MGRVGVADVLPRDGHPDPPGAEIERRKLDVQSGGQHARGAVSFLAHHLPALPQVNPVPEDRGARQALETDGQNLERSVIDQPSPTLESNWSSATSRLILSIRKTKPKLAGSHEFTSLGLWMTE